MLYFQTYGILLSQANGRTKKVELIEQKAELWLSEAGEEVGWKRETVVSKVTKFQVK
jgi:hypothetical protein